MLYVGTDNSSNSDLILLQLVAYTLFRVKDNLFQCRIESLFLLYYRLVFNVYTYVSISLQAAATGLVPNQPLGILIRDKNINLWTTITIYISNLYNVCNLFTLGLLFLVVYAT